MVLDPQTFAVPDLGVPDLLIPDLAAGSSLYLRLVDLTAAPVIGAVVWVVLDAPDGVALVGEDGTSLDTQPIEGVTDSAGVAVLALPEVGAARPVGLALQVRGPDGMRFRVLFGDLWAFTVDGATFTDLPTWDAIVTCAVSGSLITMAADPLNALVSFQYRTAAGQALTLSDGTVVMPRPVTVAAVSGQFRLPLIPSARFRAPGVLVEARVAPFVLPPFVVPDVAGVLLSTLL